MFPALVVLGPESYRLVERMGGRGSSGQASARLQFSTNLPGIHRATVDTNGAGGSGSSAEGGPMAWAVAARTRRLLKVAAIDGLVQAVGRGNRRGHKRSR